MTFKEYLEQRITCIKNPGIKARYESLMAYDVIKDVKIDIVNIIKRKNGQDVYDYIWFAACDGARVGLNEWVKRYMSYCKRYGFVCEEIEVNELYEEEEEEEEEV